MEDVIIRFARFEDADKLMKLAIAYFHESMFSGKLEMCGETTLRTIATAIESGAAIVAEDSQGHIVAMVLLAVTYSIFKSGDLGVDVFYVSPAHRGTPCSNRLQDAVMEIVKRGGYACAYEGSTSGFGHRVERQFTNMLKKRGFVETGPACVYLNPNCEESRQ